MAGHAAPQTGKPAITRLYITWPGLSRAIAKLEHVLEVQLVTPTRNSVELIEAGDDCCAAGRRLLGDLDGTIARVRMANLLVRTPTRSTDLKV